VPAEADPVAAASVTAKQALERLLSGNARFARGEARALAASGPRAELTEGQRPWATILGCSDSRVPPELIFDAGFGDLFVIRIAGNLISPEVAGSLQYAATQLATPLFVVLGHEGCGAVKAALAARRGTPADCARIQLLLDGILPGLAGLAPGGAPAAELTRAVEANVRWSARRIRESPEGQAALAAGHMDCVGAVYELASGRVRFLTP
jgi:carbonic anhydrase